MRKLKNLRKKSLDELLETMPAISDLQLGKFVGGGGQDYCYYCNPYIAHGYYFDPGGYYSGNNAGSTYCSPGGYFGPDGHYCRPDVVDFEQKGSLNALLEWFKYVNQGGSAYASEMIDFYSARTNMFEFVFGGVNYNIGYTVQGVQGINILFSKFSYGTNLPANRVEYITTRENGGLFYIVGRHGTNDVIRIGIPYKEDKVWKAMLNAIGYKY